MLRFVVIGMTNPASERPEHALWTRPVGCSGHRLWQMAAARTGVSEEDWLAMTDRRNLCVGGWCREDALVAARAMTPEIRSRTTVLLGAEVASCFPSTGMLCQWQRPTGTPPRNPSPWIHIPHPSGMCRWYNSPANRVCVEILLGDLVLMARGRMVA